MNAYILRMHEAYDHGLSLIKETLKKEKFLRSIQSPVRTGVSVSPFRNNLKTPTPKKSD
jgi:hypothetical protein